MFNIEEEKVNTKYLLLLITIAYMFSLGIRMIWVYQFNGIDDFMWNNQLMINTNDGYYFATAVKNFIFSSNLDNPQLSSALHSYPGVIYATLFFYKITPFSLETIILYMPAIISSLVVIPMILIMRLYNQTVMGFFAALLGSIAWSYYNRTMIGYYDSDMFAVLMQIFVLYTLVRIVNKQTIENILFASLMIIIYPLFYPQGLTLIYAMYTLLSLYMIFYHREKKITYIAIFILAISLLVVPIYLKFILLFGIYFLFKKIDFEIKYFIYLAIIGFIVFLFGGNVISLIIEKISGYLATGTKDEGLHFYGVIQTVREAGKIPFEVMANRISGSQVGVIAALVGYILLVIKHRPFILALPLIGIGVFSLWGGLRFTVYAVPIAAIGAIFLFYVIASLSKKPPIKYALIITLTVAIIYPNIMHIIQYKVPTVFNKTEVQVLDKLKEISNSKDYTLAWWDYGYPIWYYSNTNTLIDGGKHSHDNFIVSKILTTTSQTQAANLSRLAIETYVNSNYRVAANEIFKNKKEDNINSNLLLDELEMDDYKLPKKTRDIFLYLPNRMLNILPTVNIFSNLDLVTGKENQRPFFFQSKHFNDTPDVTNLGSEVKIFKTKGQVQIGNQVINIANFIITEYDKAGVLQKRVQVNDIKSPISVIFMKNYNTFLVLDNNMLNSTFIQLFVLENYDKNLFEPVILNPHAKVYKLKI